MLDFENAPKENRVKILALGNGGDVCRDASLVKEEQGS